MKKLTLLIVSIVLAAGIFAQSPNQFKYQAVLRDGDGSIMSDESVVLDISILQGNISGTSVFDEQHSVTTTANGVINLDIGSVEDMSVIDWGADNYFIEISVNGMVMGTSQILSVPYALYAERTGLWQKSGDTAYYNGKVGIGTASPDGDLHIFDDQIPWLKIETPATDQWAIADLRTPANVLQFSVLGNDATGGGVILKNTANIDAIAPGGLNIINEENSHIAFFLNGYDSTDEKMRITSEGNVGIGANSPGEKLEIDGAFKVGDGGYTGITDGAVAPVPAGGAGTIIFLGSHFFGWDGTAWQQLD
jgi:hypothetical protein